LVLLKGVIYVVVFSNGLWWQNILPGLINIDKGIQAILRNCFRNFTSFNVGITDLRIYEVCSSQ
jgi:hypothetical protein